MFWFIVLLLCIGAGFYFYQKMMSIEQEIRAEQELEKANSPAVQEPKKHPEESPKTTIFDSENDLAVVIQEPVTIEETILAEVLKNPGLKQTDLYQLPVETSKKQMQKLLKEMADNGKIKRGKKGSSYLLYPA